jgi:hypothetical protein
MADLVKRKTLNTEDEYLKSNLSTHRALQIATLLNKLEGRISTYQRASENLSRINNQKGADDYLARCARLTSIVDRIRALVSPEQLRVAVLDDARAHWMALAEDELRVAKRMESRGRPYSSTDSYYVRAMTYQRTAEALSIQIKSGVSVCSCHFKPFVSENSPVSLRYRTRSISAEM